MSINRFVNQPDNPFHSSGYVKPIRGRRIGSTSPQSFSQRARIEANRQAIAKYRDSHVASGQVSYGDKRRLDVAAKNAQVQPQPPEPQQHSQPVPPRSFQEPPKRGYNPYA